MRDTYYQDLMDSMNNDTCPICDQIHRKTIRMLDYLLYENVNDGGVRKDFLSSNGFCIHHANMMLELGDPLGHAILYDDLLEQMAHSLKRNTHLSYQTSCSLCESERFNEIALLNSFLISFEEDEFKRRYETSSILCIYHLDYMNQSSTNPPNRNLASINEITQKKYQQLRQNLSEIKRKNDYRYADEPWTEKEKTAWKQVVKLTIDQGKHRRR